MTTRATDETRPPLTGRRVAFVGRLGGMTRREAAQLVRQHGGVPVEARGAPSDLVVLGADQLPLEAALPLDDATRRAAQAGQIEIINETELWERLGLVETELRLYTPAMLAELVGVPLSVIRRWHRRRLIVPTREVHRLAYFDFQQVVTARQLARLLSAGVTPSALEQQLADLAQFVPAAQRSLDQLSVIVEGSELLLRQGEGLIERGGQRRIDFAALDASAPRTAGLAAGPPVTPGELVAAAAQCEDEGRLDTAVELLRAALAAGGPRPETCFQLAELLYRRGDLSAARERYLMTLELDEEYVEARANLGCVLAECGDRDLAVAAFQGALVCHPDYPDVHFHLARTLDELQRPSEAEQHWSTFLALAPDSPWSDEARRRLGTA